MSQARRLSRPVRSRLRTLVEPYPGFKRAFLNLPGVSAALEFFREPTSASIYHDWTSRCDTMDALTRETITRQIRCMTERPRIAVVMPVYNPPAELLRSSIESVRAQLWPEWQLCIADDASPAPHVLDVLEEFKHDPRIRVIRRNENGHISAASNSALAMADAGWVALLDHDDLLPEHALYRVALEILAYPEAQVIYSDEDKIDGEGRRGSPYLKPDFDPDLLLGHNMVSHLGVYRRDLLEHLGGLRVGYEGSQDYDLALRAVASVGHGKVRHIPNVLYHWRQQTGGRESFSEAALSRCVATARQAIEEHLTERGDTGARVVSAPGWPDWTRVVWPVPSPAPLVSIIYLVRQDQADMRVEKLRAGTDYPNFEVVVPLSDSSVGPCPGARWISVSGSSHWSAVVNQAVTQAKGEIIVILGGDILPQETGWLRELVSQSLRPEIGAVGGKVISSKGRIRSAGFVLGQAGVATPAYHGASSGDPGYMGALALVRRVSAVGVMCLAMRRELFEGSGGLAEGEIADFADIDLCLRLNAEGHATLYTPFATVLQVCPEHLGSLEERFPQAAEAMRRRWGEALDQDSWFNPWLILKEGLPTFRTTGMGPMAKLLSTPSFQAEMARESVASLS